MHPYLKAGLIAVAAYAVVALVQSQVSIPVVGKYLPKASS